MEIEDLNKKRKMICVNLNDWEKVGMHFYGADKKDWRFKCANCGHIQSINSILSHNHTLDAKEVGKTIYCECEGRINKGYGCDWSLYGLFQCHKLIVEDTERSIEFKSFLFGNDNANKQLEELKIRYGD